jgi:hypothetical protein
MREVILVVSKLDFRELKNIINAEERHTDEWLDREGVQNLVIYLDPKKDRRVLFTIKDES